MQHQHSVPDSCALGKTDRTPGPRWAVGEPGGRWWERRGSGEEGSVRGRHTPAKHYFQSVRAGRICSGTTYFPIVTALADSASVADPKPCSGACFLIKEENSGRIPENSLLFTNILVVTSLGQRNSATWTPLVKACQRKADGESVRGTDGCTKLCLHTEGCTGAGLTKETNEQRFLKMQNSEPHRGSSRARSAGTGETQVN